MSTYKRIDGDYNITTINSDDDINITTNTVTINGNLNVVGELTYIEVNELKVDDPFILVAANNTGSFASPTFPDQGLVTQTSSGTYAGIRFDNGNATWQISPSVYSNGAPIVAYANIAQGSGVTDRLVEQRIVSGPDPLQPTPDGPGAVAGAGRWKNLRRRHRRTARICPANLTRTDDQRSSSGGGPEP